MRISDWSSDVCSSDLIADVYSFYAGPTFARRIARLDVGAGYRFGYTKTDIDTPGAATAGIPEGIFDSSTNHAAWASVGARPGDLPFGWQLSGGWEREDASQLDQRYDGKYVRADVTVRSEEHTSELQSLMRISYAVFCLKKKT